MDTYFNAKEMISFGNFLLSEERTEMLVKHPETTEENISERINQVSHADFENWKQKNDKD